MVVGRWGEVSNPGLEGHLKRYFRQVRQKIFLVGPVGHFDPSALIEGRKFSLPKTDEIFSSANHFSLRAYDLKMRCDSIERARGEFDMRHPCMDTGDFAFLSFVVRR